MIATPPDSLTAAPAFVPPPAPVYPPESAPRRFPDRFTVKSEGSFIFLRFAEVDWIEAQGDYVKFHLGPKGCLVRMTMKVLERSIDPARFLRIHRSTFVNLDRIEKISPFRERHYAVVLRDGTRLRISGAYRSRVREIYLNALSTARFDEPAIAASSC